MIFLQIIKADGQVVFSKSGFEINEEYHGELVSGDIASGELKININM